MKGQSTIATQKQIAMELYEAEIIKTMSNSAEDIRK